MNEEYISTQVKYGESMTCHIDGSLKTGMLFRFFTSAGDLYSKAYWKPVVGFVPIGPRASQAQEEWADQFIQTLLAEPSMPLTAYDKAKELLDQLRQANAENNKASHAYVLENLEVLLKTISL